MDARSKKRGGSGNPYKGTEYERQFGHLYDFYAKDIRKFLNKEYKDVQLVTDDKGNTWYEIKVDPTAKDKPVMTHAKAGIPIPPPQEEEEEPAVKPQDKQMKELFGGR